MTPRVFKSFILVNIFIIPTNLFEPFIRFFRKTSVITAATPCKIAHCTIRTVAKDVTNLQTEYEATEALAEVASLSLNSIAKTGIQCSSLLGSSRPDSVDLLKLR